jgi:hypothetical protein
MPTTCGAGSSKKLATAELPNPDLLEPVDRPLRRDRRSTKQSLFSPHQATALRAPSAHSSLLANPAPCIPICFAATVAPAATRPSLARTAHRGQVRRKVSRTIDPQHSAALNKSDPCKRSAPSTWLT